MSRLVEPDQLRQLLRAKQAVEVVKALHNLPLHRYKDPNQLNQLGLIAQSINFHECARKIFERALYLAGPHVVLLNNLSLSLIQLGEPITAERNLRKALRIEPNYDKALINLGSVLIQLLRPNEAAEVFEKVRALHPHQPEALLGLALAAQSLGHTAEAIKWSESVLQLSPIALEAFQVLAESLRAERRYEDAAKVLHQAIEHHPKASGLFFELGHLYHQNAAYQEALDTFRKAHNLISYKLSDKKAFLKDRSQLETVYKKLASSSPPQPAPVDISQPIFVVGSPRSGTTLLDRMLSSHPQLSSLGETHIVGRIAAEGLKKWSKGKSFAEFVEKLWLEPDSELNTFCRTQFKQRIQQLTGPVPSGRVIDKMPSNAWRLGFVAAIAPGAPILHMVRDGRDVALSAFSQNFTYPPWHAHTLEDGILEWVSTLTLTRTALEACPAPYLSIHYEQLVLEPEATLSHILDFLGLPFHQDCLQFHVQEGPVGTASRFQVREPLNTRSIGRAQLYPEVYNQLTLLAHDELKAWGYDVNPIAKNSSFTPKACNNSKRADC